MNDNPTPERQRLAALEADAVIARERYSAHTTLLAAHAEILAVLMGTGPLMKRLSDDLDRAMARIARLEAQLNCDPPASDGA